MFWSSGGVRSHSRKLQVLPSESSWFGSIRILSKLNSLKANELGYLSPGNEWFAPFQFRSEQSLLNSLYGEVNISFKFTYFPSSITMGWTKSLEVRAMLRPVYSFVFWHIFLLLFCHLLAETSNWDRPARILHFTPFGIHNSVALTSPRAINASSRICLLSFWCGIQGNYLRYQSNNEDYSPWFIV